MYNDPATDDPRDPDYDKPINVPIIINLLTDDPRDPDYGSTLHMTPGQGGGGPHSGARGCSGGAAGMRVGAAEEGDVDGDGRGEGRGLGGMEGTVDSLLLTYFSLYSDYVQYKSFAKLTFYYYVKVRRGHAGRDARLFPGGPGAGRRVWVTDAFSVHRGMLAVI